MIFKIKTMHDVDILKSRFCNGVINECKRLAGIFDDNYNCNSMDGGFAAVVENKLDLEYVKVHYVDYTSIPYEFADIIPDSEFVSVLFLPATEYAVNLIIPMSVLPESIAVSSDGRG